jgi:hypothetical protein
MESIVEEISPGDDAGFFVGVPLLLGQLVELTSSKGKLF